TGFHFVNGMGSGSMASVAKGVHEAGGQMLGIGTEYYYKSDPPNADNYNQLLLYPDNDNDARTKAFDDFSKYKIVMPGGSATFFELAKEWVYGTIPEYFGKSAEKRPPIILYQPPGANVNFWEPMIQMTRNLYELMAQSRRMMGQSVPPFAPAFVIANSPEQ